MAQRRCDDGVAPKDRQRPRDFEGFRQHDVAEAPASCLHSGIALANPAEVTWIVNVRREARSALYEGERRGSKIGTGGFEGEDQDGAEAVIPGRSLASVKLRLERARMCDLQNGRARARACVLQDGGCAPLAEFDEQREIAALLCGQPEGRP